MFSIWTVLTIATAIRFWIVEIFTSKVVPQMPIYRHHLQNRRLRVQVLVPLPGKVQHRSVLDFFYWAWDLNGYIQQSCGLLPATAWRSETSIFFLFAERKCKQVLVPLPVKHRDSIKKSRCFTLNIAVFKLRSSIARMRYPELPFKLPLWHSKTVAFAQRCRFSFSA